MLSHAFLYILLPFVSFITASILIYFLRKIGIKHNYCDRPGEFKIHHKPIPYLGGIGIFLGFVTALLVARLFKEIPLRQVIGIGSSSIIFLVFGLWDDSKWKKSEESLLKLAIQFVIAFIIVFILLYIGIDFRFTVNPFFWGLVTALYIIAIMNTVNITDALDGLTGSLTIISLLGFLVLSIYTQNTLSLILSLSLIGSLIGFLIYNWRPASIFMGDNGSHFLGFSLAILTIIFTGHPIYNFHQFIGPLLIIAFPLINTVWVTIRRLVAKKSPFFRDRRHLYDQIHTDLGFSTPQTVLLCCALQMFLMVLGVFLYTV